MNPGDPGKEGEPLPELHVPETYTVDFRPSSILKDRLKADRAKKDGSDG